jgi:hypothetical protein
MTNMEKSSKDVLFSTTKPDCVFVGEDMKSLKRDVPKMPA